MITPIAQNVSTVYRNCELYTTGGLIYILLGFITAIVAIAGAAAPVGSSIFYRECQSKMLDYLPCLTRRPAALPQMALDLDTTPTITNLTVALYMLAMSIFPLWW